MAVKRSWAARRSRPARRNRVTARKAQAKGVDRAGDVSTSEKRRCQWEALKMRESSGDGTNGQANWLRRHSVDDGTLEMCDHPLCDARVLITAFCRPTTKIISAIVALARCTARVWRPELRDWSLKESWTIECNGR